MKTSHSEVIPVITDFDFNTFMQSKATAIVHYCAAITGGADAEDAAQEAFLRLWRHLPRKKTLHPPTLICTEPPTAHVLTLSVPGNVSESPQESRKVPKLSLKQQK